jgi:hypothetical protein
VEESAASESLSMGGERETEHNNNNINKEHTISTFGEFLIRERIT